jgi:hypothetical protein
MRVIALTSHPLRNVFEAMMEKGQDQIPDKGFLITKMPRYFIVTVDKTDSKDVIEILLKSGIKLHNSMIKNKNL